MKVYKGRTIFEILTGRNKRNMTPLELQYHNPLEAKVGCTCSLEDEGEYSGINFVIEKLGVFKTEIGPETFFHTDYHLRGTTLETNGYIRMRIRLIHDNTVVNSLGHRVQLLQIYDEMQYDEGFHKNVLGDPTGIFDINQDDDGNQLEEPRRYWRIGSEEGKQLPDPYYARLTLMNDTDGDGQIESDELQHREVTYWEFHRVTVDQNEQEFTEFLTVEMDNETGYFTFLRGSEVQPSQILIV